MKGSRYGPCKVLRENIMFWKQKSLFLMILLKNLFASLLIFSSWNYLFHFTTIGWLFFFLFIFYFSSVWWYKFRTRWTIFDQDDKKFLYFSTSKLSEFFINVVFLTWWFFTISRLGLTLFSADKFLYLPDINKNILKFSFSWYNKVMKYRRVLFFSFCSLEEIFNVGTTISCTTILKTFLLFCTFLFPKD